MNDPDQNQEPERLSVAWWKVRAKKAIESWRRMGDDAEFTHEVRAVTSNIEEEESLIGHLRELERLREKLVRATSLIVDAEWVTQESSGYQECPWCELDRESEHADDCPILEFIQHGGPQ